MYSAYSFVTIQSMIDNAVGKVAPLGELSPTSATFSKELGFYADAAAAPYARLVCFRSTNAADTVNNVTLIPMPVTYSTPLLQVANWFAQKSITGGFTNDSTLAAQNFSTEFPNFTLLDIGKMYSNAQGRWLPGSVAVKLNTSGEDNYLRLWFVDEAFKGEYSFYTIEILPPLEPIDELTKDYETVIPKLQALTIPGQLKKADARFSATPTTHLIGESWEWYDFEDASQHTPAPYIYAIWGAAGNNADAIREATREYILANSAYGQDRWEIHHPDLFIPTEFYLIPLWDRVAIPAQTLLNGLYRPAVKPVDAQTLARATMVDYPAAWVNGNVEVVSTTVKSAVMLALGNQKNRLAKPTWTEQWPGYAAIPTTHIDFDNLDPDTQGFIYILNQMLVTAESLTMYSDIPTGMTRLERGGKLYLSASYKDCQYLMLAKKYWTSQ